MGTAAALGVYGGAVTPLPAVRACRRGSFPTWSHWYQATLAIDVSRWIILVGAWSKCLFFHRVQALTPHAAPGGGRRTIENQMRRLRT